MLTCLQCFGTQECPHQLWSQFVHVGSIALLVSSEPPLIVLQETRYQVALYQSPREPKQMESCTIADCKKGCVASTKNVFAKHALCGTLGGCPVIQRVVTGVVPISQAHHVPMTAAFPEALPAFANESRPQLPSPQP